MRPFTPVVVPLAIMLLLMISRGEAAAASSSVPESEIVTAPGYQSQMPCTQPEMMQMMDEGSGGAQQSGTSGDGSSHAAHHPAVASTESAGSISPPDLMDQLTGALGQASSIIQAIEQTQPFSTAQKGVTLHWADQLRVVY